MSNLFSSWHIYAVFGAYMVFMAAVGGMPAPDATSSKGYIWLFRFLNSLAVNVHAVAGTIPQIPQVPQIPQIPQIPQEPTTTGGK
jgi:hypothetical protein